MWMIDMIDYEARVIGLAHPIQTHNSLQGHIGICMEPYFNPTK